MTDSGVGRVNGECERGGERERKGEKESVNSAFYAGDR